MESAGGDEDRIVDAHPAPLADEMTSEVAALKDSDEVDEEEGGATGTGGSWSALIVPGGRFEGAHPWVHPNS